MKKALIIAACLGGLILGMAGVSSATIYTDTVSLNDTYLWGKGEFKWDHALPGDFHAPYDFLSATLQISARLVNGSNDRVLVANIPQGHLNPGTSFSVFDVADVLATWNGGDTLDVTLKFNESLSNGWTSGFYLTSSVLALDYGNGNTNGGDGGNNGTVPTPEPSTLLLLGSGLTGFAFWRRRNSGS